MSTALDRRKDESPQDQYYYLAVEASLQTAGVATPVWRWADGQVLITFQSGSDSPSYSFLGKEPALTQAVTWKDVGLISYGAVLHRWADAKEGRLLLHSTPATVTLSSYGGSRTLWETLRSPLTRLNEKLAVLEDLKHDAEVSESETFVDFLCRELAVQIINEPWRISLIRAAETALCQNPDRRWRLGEVLKAQAVSLRQSDSRATEGALWAALRRLATILPVEGAGWFVEFLSDSASGATRQAALQAVQAMFAIERPVASTSIEALRGRISELLRKVLDRDILAISGNTVAFAANAYCAAALAECVDLDEFTRMVLRTQRPVLIRTCRRLLEVAGRSMEPSADDPAARARGALMAAGSATSGVG